MKISQLIQLLEIFKEKHGDIDVVYSEDTYNSLFFIDEKDPKVVNYEGEDVLVINGGWYGG